MGSNTYKDLIFTNHALARMRQRRISPGDAYATFKRAELSRQAATSGAIVYYKTWDRKRIEVVAKKNEQGEWVVLSVWDRPVTPSRTRRQTKPSAGSWLFRVIKKLLIG